MSWIVGLVLAVLVLVALEVIVPGGVLGLCGCLSFAATGLCFIDRFFPALVLFVATACAALLLAIVQFRWWIRSSAGRGLFLRAVVGKSPSTKLEADTLMGRNCETLTRLNPSGRVLLDGESYEAYSRDGYIEAHTTVRIVGRDSFKLIIQKT